MKRKCICFIFWILLIFLAYGGGYLCMVWPLSSGINIEESKIIPVTAGKDDFILPDTRLITEIINLKTSETILQETPMPAMYIGLDREDLLTKLNDYMVNLSIEEREKGLVAFELESYSRQELVLKKLYYPNDDFQKFYLIYKQGRMVVYYSDRKTVYDYPDIKLYDLPLDIQCQVIAGMDIKDEIDLYKFLQNYSS